MELFFLALLVVLLVLALSSGFPVAFALPGSAILTIAIAALCGWMFAGDMDAYFAQDGPKEWLSAGVTNFRSLYWDVERDTLIAIPLFVFMGIMLQRSRIAEDLLVTMAQLFGPVPGGLGISVVFVGALLAATTGIVGATVIAMGLISLPAMLRNNYSKSLASGTICASGTLGQIIPPSIVLIILADQLSSAADQASTARKSAYKDATGEFSMPSEFDVVSASAGDMFMGAFIPGLVLVGLYMLYILVYAHFRPKVAPPVPREGGFDAAFGAKIVISLIPPLALIFAVLGSIIMGVATVNQAGAIGAIGAMIMGGYRLTAGKRTAFYPIIIALVSLVGIFYAVNAYDLNIKNIETDADAQGIVIAAVCVVALMVAILWSAWRAYTIEDTLRGVMMETAKTTSMVFIILIGAAMLTSAFRAFGGEELVREYLNALPGGFWTQFIVVMAVIFLLGFFLDFIEIAVVVVPIVAPILLANPEANITAVWLGVMIGLNIQTSFLTPPFGFALFYLRGVAPPEVKTLDIYRGAALFISLQLGGLVIVGAYPSLVNYLPNRIFLTSENAPPPLNPKLQACLQDEVFDDLMRDKVAIKASIDELNRLDFDLLPARQSRALAAALNDIGGAVEKSEAVRDADLALTNYAPQYQPLRREVRRIESSLKQLVAEQKLLERRIERLVDDEGEQAPELGSLRIDLERIQEEQKNLEAARPQAWKTAREQYLELAQVQKKARIAYRQSSDNAYEKLVDTIALLDGAQALEAFKKEIPRLAEQVTSLAPEAAVEELKLATSVVGQIPGANKVRSAVSKARRALRGRKPNPEKALQSLAKAEQELEKELAWRLKAQSLRDPLNDFANSIRLTVGARKQASLDRDRAKSIAVCQSQHRDISLAF